MGFGPLLTGGPRTVSGKKVEQGNRGVLYVAISAVSKPLLTTSSVHPPPVSVGKAARDGIVRVYTRPQLFRAV